MTITLPADPETERLARKLAELSGKSLTAVVHEAIAAQAAAAGVASQPRAVRPNRAELLARMIEITEGFRNLPVYDARSPDEILGYDDNGLPS
jgi:antitoxin VapB